MESIRIVTCDSRRDEVRLDYVLGFRSRLLSGDGSDYSMFGTMGHVQETQKHRSVLKTPEMSVLCLHVHRSFDMRRTLLFGVRNACPDVDYLGSGVLKHYNHV